MNKKPPDFTVVKSGGAESIYFLFITVKET